MADTDGARRAFGPGSSGVKDLLGLVEIVPGRLYLATCSSGRRRPDTASSHFFTSDADGVRGKRDRPPDLGRLAQYVRRLNGKMYDRRYESKAIVHCCDKYDDDDDDDAVLLVGAYAIAARRMDPRTVFAMLKDSEDRATSGHGVNAVGLYDCLSVVHKAVNYRLVDFHDFDCRQYYASSDLTWIVPDKLIAFRGPVDGRLQHYVEYFRKNNVKTVIRLNRANYDGSRFSDAGIEHVDLYFEDGTAPSNVILQTFLNVSELTPGAIAVHCRAGLGRTGTLIAAYLVRHYRMTAREAVAWTRMCRPGSVAAGPQQSFLTDKQNALWKTGDALRKDEYGNAAKVSYCDRGLYSVNSRRNSTSTAAAEWNATNHYSFGYRYRKSAFSDR